AGAPRPPDEVDRRRHAQHDGLSCEPEMTITTTNHQRKAREDRKGRSGFARFAAFAFLVVAGAVAGAQIPTDSWPTYHGDYSGRRYSTIKQINASNVKNLTLAWVYRLNTSRAGAIVGGEGPETPPPGTAPTIKSTP